MGFLLPTALGLLALVVPVIILYMLKLRRREQVVSSSLLWRQVLLDRTANAPWQRLRRNILLVLQLLLLILLVLSLARPFFRTDSVAEGNIVVVLDASASMSAGGPGLGTRWEDAVVRVEQIIEGLDSNKMSLIWAGPSPRIAAPPTSDQQALRNALHSLRPSDGEAALDAALTLAAGSARQIGSGATVAFVSDGAFPSSLAVPIMPNAALYIHTGGTARNLAITAFSLRDTAGGPEAFASIYNNGDITSTALLSMIVDGVLRDTKRVEVGPGADVAVTFAGLPLDTLEAEVRLTPDVAATDSLSVDNSAWLIRTAQSEDSILLVTEGNGFLEKALNLVQGVRVSKTAPAGYAQSGSYGLTILDGYMPPRLPDGNLLLFAPTNTPLIPVSGTLQNPLIGQIELTDPLLRFVDLSGVHVASAVLMESPPWARVLVRTESGDPLLMVGEVDGRRVVVFGFDLHQSDLPLQVAFPILMSNLTAWLLPGQAVDGSNLRAGEVLTVRLLPEANKVTVTTPKGDRVEFSSPVGTEIQFADTTQLGIYVVQQSVERRALGGDTRYAVNLLSRDESNITPRADIGFAGSASAPLGEAQRPLEIWPWLLLASLLLLGVEWWVYNKGNRLLSTRRAR